MKRRAIVAVLLVLALAALVSIGCGGTNRQDAVIKGEPVTGGHSVTRSVAWIEAHHRLVARNPALAEERAEAEEQAAAEEAQREEAEREGEASAGGEAAAKGEPVEENVREKPEPGEELGPPKSAGQAVPLPRTGRAAIGPRSSLDEGTSFLGADSGDSGFIPPDSMGSVGPTQIVVFVNGLIRVYDKDGNVVALDNVSDADFWSTELSPGAEPTDPGVEYDRLEQRWIISAIDTKSTNNRVMLAVSDGPEITDETDFTFYHFNEQAPLGGSNQFADYPQMAVDANAVYIGVNLFSSSSGSFAGTAAYVVRKSSVTTPGTPVVTGFRFVTSPGGAGMDSPQPATDMDPTVGEGYFIGPDNQFLNRLDVRRITDPGGTPGVSLNQTVTVPTTSAPLAVPAQGATGGLDPLDDRLFEAMIGRGPDGTDTLWTAHNIRVNSSGVGSSTGDRDGARWYQIGDLSSNPPTLTQSGTLFDTAVANPRFFWMPSIAMNGQGHASLNTSTAGLGRFAEVASSAHLASEPLGTTESFDLTQSSNSPYNLGSDSPKRWGDYSQTVVDPNDDQTFWTFQEYANSTNSWGVRVIQLKAPPPATPASASPNTIQTGETSVDVDITGTSLDGSEFFDTTDPGPPYPDFDHISADVSGGVVVNSITYTDPTHVTLNLDTTAATTGAQSVTITNPDGQSTSCVPLVIGTDADAPSAPNPQNTTPGSPGNSTTPLVFGSNAECGSTVSLYTDAACTNPATATGSSTTFSSPGIPVTVPANQPTSFWATATDVANNTSACSTAHATYVEDSIPPAVTVDSGPTGTTTDASPTFTFSATDSVGPITFQCSIDTGTASFGVCSGPGNTDTPSSPLAAGSHTFRVQATDAAGNSAVASRAFTVEIPQPPAPPDTAITKGPKKKTTKRRPKFKFTSTQAGSTFQCQLDKGQFAPCTSPFVPPRKLELGKHVLKVKAIGPTGVPDTAPAVKKFKVIA
jgi:Bacterial Ig-like domain